MKSAIKKKWIKALLSRKYKQGQGALCNGDRFCCLGVLCDLHAKETKTKWETVTVLGCTGIKYFKYFDYTDFPPPKVYKWAGLPVNRRDQPDASCETIQTLVVANDGGKKFKTIAKIIEKTL
jgi:hypothetical protein